MPNYYRLKKKNTPCDIIHVSYLSISRHKKLYTENKDGPD